MNTATYWICVTSLTVISGEPWAECARQDYFTSTGDGAVAYRQRETRCEGTYPKGVAARVEFIGYHAGELSFESKEASNLKAGTARISILGMADEKDKPVLLHAQSFKPDLYYQMDTDRFDNSGTFVWPLDIIQTVKLQANELALVACSNKCLVGSPATKYWPVAVNGNSTKTYQFVIVPSRTLGRMEMAIYKDRELIKNYVDPRRFHEAGTAVKLDLPLLKSGQYTADIKADIYGRNDQIKETIRFVSP